MKIRYESTFLKDLKKIENKNLKKRIYETIEEIKKAENLSDLRNVKKIKSHTVHYRIRLGDYRIGIVIQENMLTLERFLHRKDIYRLFPRKGKLT